MPIFVLAACLACHYFRNGRCLSAAFMYQPRVELPFCCNGRLMSRHFLNGSPQCDMIKCEVFKHNT